MAENDQAAVVQELYRRRDSLDPEKRAVVDELAKRLNIAAPPKDRIQAGVEAFDRTKAAFEAQPRKSMMDSAMDAGKQIASTIAAPIAGIPDAVRAVGDFLRNPNEWARRHFDPSQANVGPGEMGVNPVAEAQGLAVTAALPAAAEGVSAGVRAGAKTVGQIARTPGVPALVEGIPEVVGGAMHGGPVGMMAVGRGVSQVIGGIKEVKASLATTRAAAVAAESTAAKSAMAPAADLSPAPAGGAIPPGIPMDQLGQFPARQVLDYLQQKPALTEPAPPAPEITPANAGPMPAKTVAKARATRTKAAPAPEAAKPEPSNVITIPSPKPEFLPEEYAAPARAKKATAIAEYLHKEGIPYETARGTLDAEAGGPDRITATKSWWDTVAKQAGQRQNMSPDTIKATLFELKQLEKKSAAVNKNPKAAAIAAELAQEMTQ